MPTCPTGARMTLELRDSQRRHDRARRHRRVAPRRRGRAPTVRPGLGVEFQDVAPQLGALIDKLVTGFRGVQILLLSGDRQDRTTLARNIKSIICDRRDHAGRRTRRSPRRVLTGEVDVAIVDVDFDVEGGLATLRAAKEQDAAGADDRADRRTPAYREQAAAAGADELLANPPPFAELQVVLVRALGKPIGGAPGLDAERRQLAARCERAAERRRLAAAAASRLDRVLEQARDRHRADAAGHRRDRARALRGGGELDVADELALGRAVDADVEHDRAFA